MGDQVADQYVFGRPLDGVDRSCGRKVRSMVFTIFVNQNLVVDGEDLGPAPVEGVPDAEQLVQNLPHKYLVYGREVCPDSGNFHLQGIVIVMECL